MNNNQEDPNWSEYYQLMNGHPPHEPLLKAIEFFNTDGYEKNVNYAVDLGCGSGNDSLELLRRGWNVTAIDREEEALGWLESAVSPEEKARLLTKLSDFKDIIFPQVQLINAGYSLPFCTPEIFPKLWQNIVEAILPAGRFSGHLFGKNDDYRKDPKITIHSREDIHKLFKEFEIEYFDVRDQLGPTIGGIEKQWHVFSVVAKKK